MDPVSIAQGARSDSLESIKVLVRVRPLSSGEIADGNESVVDILGSQSLSVTSSDGKKSFRCAFDAVLGPSSSQIDVYEVVRGCTESVIEGYNSTIFAYGQTGSGKTYSMYGPPNSGPQFNASSRVPPRDPDQIGLIPRAIEEIFELVHNRSIRDFQVHCSFVQIYNENLYDMLRDASMNTPLSIREDNKEIYVQGLSEYNVKSVADTMQLLKIAEENRAIRETNMNMFSSRSHSIFQIQLEHKRVADDGGEITCRAKFNLVDLAGSEKWNTKLQMKDEHIAEMTNINLSLHTLGKCISALAQASLRQAKESESRAQTRDRERDRAPSADWDNRSLGSLDHSGSTVGSIKDFPVPKSGRYANTGGNNNSSSRDPPGTHIPFRESKLTRLLQDSLGGNAKTFLIATISPARSNSEESISTLKFADRAKQVMVQAVVNESRPVDYALVKRLQQEVEMLKSLVKRLVQAQGPAGGAGGGGGGVSVNAAIFNAKLKQANTAADLSELVAGNGSGSGSGGVGSSVRSSSGHVGSPFSVPSPGRYSPDMSQQMYTPGAAVEGVAGSAAMAPEGGGLEYVISLEKALNQEQINSQHLAKKNETLIKELEELKFQNMQLQQQTGQLAVGGARGAVGGVGGVGSVGGTAGYNTPAPLTKQISINSLAITSGQVTQVIESVQALLKENSKLLEHTEQVQKIMKKFFKFQIEEEEMKKSLETVFAAAKEIKAASASANVVDNFAFLEFLATNVNNKGAVASTSNTPSPSKIASVGVDSPVDNSYGQGMQTAQQAVPAKKQLRRVPEPSHGPHGQLPAMEGAPTLKGGSSSSSGMDVAGVSVRENKKSQAYLAQKELSQQRNLPALQPHSGYGNSYSGMAEEASYTVQRGRESTSAGSDADYPQAHQGYEDSDYYQSANSNFSRQTHHQQQYQPQYQPQHYQQQYPGLDGRSALAPPQPSAVPTMTYRVRGAPGQLGAAGPSTNGSTGSLASSGGWVVPAEEEAAAAEAALKAELKQAKKKLKKQQKMAEWQRIKEEKQRAEQEAEEAQRAAEAAAEAEKEQKRREYAQKQKQKLAQYQSKVKSEAEKIQELKNLGIDPSSLF